MNPIMPELSVNEKPCYCWTKNVAKSLTERIEFVVGQSMIDTFDYLLICEELSRGTKEEMIFTNNGK